VAAAVTAAVASAVAIRASRVDGCVFCSPSDHPDALDSTERLILIPDLYPLVPGHLLVITKDHHRCFGAAGPEVLAELPDVVAEAAAFVNAAYGVEPVLWENGVTGQTVFHAHLHLIPLDVGDLLDDLVEDPASVEIDGWDEVAQRFEEAGDYHYIRVQGRSWLVEGNGAMNWEGRRRLFVASGMRFEAGRMVRPTSHGDVVSAAERWRDWVAAGRPAVSAGAGPAGDRARP
jgi:diadenosine tetraphosphate (Ap4A) HIT family hydrolase